jgi:hypothetical protein
VKAWLYRYRFALGYVALVAIAVGSDRVYDNRLHSELNRRDRISCEQRRVLGANQAEVLRILVLDIEQETDHPELRAEVPGLKHDRAVLLEAVKEGC